MRESGHRKHVTEALSTENASVGIINLMSFPKSGEGKRSRRKKKKGKEGLRRLIPMTTEKVSEPRNAILV